MKNCFLSKKLATSLKKETLGSHWMKNLKGLVIIMCLIFMINQALLPQKARAQEKHKDEIARIMFWAVDAQNNRDTAVFYLLHNPTGAVDTTLNKENLYGVPMSDLDVRIFQRTDSNCPCLAHPCNGGGHRIANSYWLPPLADDWYQRHRHHSVVMVRSYEQNADYKHYYEQIDSVCNIDLPHRLVGGVLGDDLIWEVAVKIRATHLPVRVFWRIYDGFYPEGYEYTANKNFCIFYLFHDSTKNYEGYSDMPEEYFGEYEDFENDIWSCCEIGFEESQNTDFVLVLNSFNLQYPFPFSCTGIEEDNDYKILYPNPANELIVIDDEGIFYLVDNIGTAIQEINILEGPYALDISTLLAGTYFLQKQNNSTIYKFIKQ